MSLVFTIRGNNVTEMDYLRNNDNDNGDDDDRKKSIIFQKKEKSPKRSVENVGQKESLFKSPVPACKYVLTTYVPLGEVSYELEYHLDKTIQRCQIQL